MSTPKRRPGTAGRAAGRGRQGDGADGRDRTACPSGPRELEGESWAHRYHDAVDWALRLRDALEACRRALETAGSEYEPDAGWDRLLDLPEL